MTTSQTSSPPFALVGGTVVDHSGSRRADVVVEDGTIRAVGEHIEIPANAERIDASDAFVVPGFVDLHAHLREPGSEEAETIETGARGAALGGFTAVVAMPNTDPAIDSPSLVRDVLALAEGVACDIFPAAAMTVGREGRLLAPMGELAAMGVRIFTDDGAGVQDPALMRSIMEYATGLEAVTGGQPVVLAQHCEVDALTEGGHMHEGVWSTRLGIGGQPSEAETLMVMRDIALARRTGAHIHVQHLSTADSVDLVRAAKASGVRITAEATTHHFTLTDAACASYDPVFKVHPPLRTEADVEAIRTGLADRTIDAIASDHAPHEPHTKEYPFDQAPPGMLGLETAVAVAMTELGFDIERIVALMSSNPARIAGVAERHGRPVALGEPANLAVLDPNERWTVSGTAMASRSHNTPYEGRELTGRIRHTVLHGDLVVLGGIPTR